MYASREPISITEGIKPSVDPRVTEIDTRRLVNPDAPTLTDYEHLTEDGDVIKLPGFKKELAEAADPKAMHADYTLTDLSDEQIDE